MDTEDRYYSKDYYGEADYENICCEDCYCFENCCKCILCPPGPRGPRGPQGPEGPPGPGGSTDYAYIYNLCSQMVDPEEAIIFSNNGVLVGGIAHNLGEAEILISSPGNYLVSFSMTGAEANQFALFLDDNLVEGSIYGAADANQQNTGQVIISIVQTSILTLRSHTSTQPVLLQTPAGGIQSNVNASIYLQKLTVSNTIQVTTAEELLSALNDSDLSIINLAPSLTVYDLSTNPPFVRTTAVRIQSTAPGAQVEFAANQDLTYLTIGDNVTLASNTIYNLTQQLFYPTIPAAVTGASDYDIILIFPGTYLLTALLVIDKPLTLRGFSASNTLIDFDPAVLIGLQIIADDVSIENLHFRITTIKPSTPNNWLLEVPTKTPPFLPPVELYDNFNLRCCIIEGGRRNGFIFAQNMNIFNNLFIHNGVVNSLQLASVQGVTNIVGNTFSGGSDSRAVMVFEPTTGQVVTSGQINIMGNVATSFTQFVLFNIVQNQNTSLLVQGNNINHQTRSGSSVIFFALGGDFSVFDSILIQNNIIINPNPQRLGVYVDFFGSTAAIPPTTDQIKVFFNRFNVALPWGKQTDTVDDNFPVGFSNPAPAGMDLNAFELIGNVNF